nr:thyroxine (T4)-binding protein, TBP {Arg-C internal fragment \
DLKPPKPPGLPEIGWP